jgi:hypothetical protein
MNHLYANMFKPLWQQIHPVMWEDLQVKIYLQPTQSNWVNITNILTQSTHIHLTLSVALWDEHISETLFLTFLVTQTHQNQYYWLILTALYLF